MGTSPLDRRRDRNDRDRNNRHRAEETDVHSLTGVYALDALDDVERARMERHLEGCTDCVAEMVSFRETSSRLGSGAAVTPPAG